MRQRYTSYVSNIMKNKFIITICAKCFVKLVLEEAVALDLCQPFGSLFRVLGSWCGD
jgi:hypothetical protein